MIKKTICFLTLVVFLNLNARSISIYAAYTDECPKITIYCIKEFCNGKKRKFGLVVDGNLKKQPEFIWSVSGGKIISGQGKGSIEVEMPDIDESLNITVEAREYEIPLGCPTIFKYEDDSHETNDRK